MCKQQPSPRCNRTGLFLLHFPENTAMLLPQLQQPSVMLLTPTMPSKKCSNTYFILTEHGDRQVRRKVAMLKFRVTYYFWEKLFLVLYVSQFND